MPPLTLSQLEEINSLVRQHKELDGLLNHYTYFPIREQQSVHIGKQPNSQTSATREFLLVPPAVIQKLIDERCAAWAAKRAEIKRRLNQLNVRID